MNRYTVKLEVVVQADSDTQARELLEAFSMTIAPNPAVLAIECTPAPGQRPEAGGGVSGVRLTDADEAIIALRANEGQVVVSVGTDPEDPVCWIVHDVREDPECRIVSTAVGGWSAGMREPVCGPDDDFLREFLSEGGGTATLVLIEDPFSASGDTP